MSGLQIAVHEVDLLETAKALADVLRTDLANALHRLQLWVGRSEDLVQSAKVVALLIAEWVGLQEERP